MNLDEIESFPNFRAGSTSMNRLSPDPYGRWGETEQSANKNLAQVKKAARQLPGSPYLYTIVPQPARQRSGPGKGYYIYVLTPDGEVIGGLDIDDHGKMFEVDKIQVLPKYQGQGLGMSLYGIALSILKKPLVAGTAQTPDSQRAWLRLSQIPGVQVMGLLQMRRGLEPFYQWKVEELDAKPWIRVGNHQLYLFPVIAGKKRMKVAQPKVHKIYGRDTDELYTTMIAFYNQQPVLESVEPEALDKKKRIQDFIQWIYDKENITDPLPSIEFTSHKESSQQHRTGYYNWHTNTMWIYTGHRNFIDVLRTVAHELIHRKQEQQHRIHKKSPPGSKLEREADAEAGYLMKLYARKHPEVIQENSEDEISNHKKLDNILIKLCEMVANRDPKKFGMVAAAVIDPDNRIVAALNRNLGQGKHLHAEPAAMRAYEKRYGEIPDGSIIITTLSPCAEPMAERQGQACVKRINQSNVHKVYCGYMDPTQHEGLTELREFTLEETANPDIRRLCKKYADTFLEDDLQEVKIDNRRGAGAVPFNQEIDYMGLRVAMTPQMFLKLALPLDVKQDDQATIDRLTQIKDTQGFGAPFLYIEIPKQWFDGDLSKSARVSSHDGRHRMLSILTSEGNDPVEVHLLLRGGLRRRDLTDKMIERLQSGMISQTGAVVRGPVFIADTVGVAEDYDPNGPPPGPESRPTMPKGTVRVDVSDLYDWYKLGTNISNLSGVDKSQFGKGPPSTIISFGDEDTEHKYINDLENLGLSTTDIDPVDPNQPPGMKRQKTDPTYNVDESVTNITELWTQPYELTSRVIGPASLEYYFDTKDNRSGRIVFDSSLDSDQGGTHVVLVIVHFYIDNLYHTSGKGDAVAIFSTVVAACRDYLRRYRPPVVTFETPDAKKRNLYVKLSGMFPDYVVYPYLQWVHDPIVGDEIVDSLMDDNANDAIVLRRRDYVPEKTRVYVDEQGVAEATGDEKFDTMMGRIASEPKVPDIHPDMPPTSIPELLQWAKENNKPYHYKFAEWAQKHNFTNVNAALMWFGDNVDPWDEFGPKDHLNVFGDLVGEPLIDAAKHNPKAAELLKVFACYEKIVFDWNDEYRQMKEQGVAEGTESLDYQGNCTEDDVIDDIFGDVNNFANMVEKYGDEFTRGKLVVRYDPETDVHSFYYKTPGVAEAFDQPYTADLSDESEHGDYDSLTQLPDGSYLTVMFNNEGDGKYQVEFWRGPSQGVTGEGDSQRIFATVLNTIQKFIKEHKPQQLTFSATKDVEPGQNSESRAKLYNRLVDRYAAAWGYDALINDLGDQVAYELTRLEPAVTENFADKKVKGRSRPGRVKRAGASCSGSVTDLRARAKNASGERARMYHWCANMKSGRQKANESPDTATPVSPQQWIDQVYDMYPQVWQNNHVMPLGGHGEDQQFAMFELVPNPAQKNTEDIKWIQAYPLRQGVGSRAMKQLQRLAHKDNITLTLYPWDKGRVSQAKLMKFYRQQGFQPTVKGSKNMVWSPDNTLESGLLESWKAFKNSK